MNFNLTFFYCLKSVFIILSLAAVFNLYGQPNNGSSSGSAMMALEELIIENDLNQIVEFIDAYVDRNARSESQWKNTIQNVIDKMRPYDGSAGLMGKSEGIVLVFSNPRGSQSVETRFGNNGKITDLILLAQEEEMSITTENIHAVFDQLEEEGMSGIVYLKRDGDIVIKRPFGLASKEANRRNTLETIFGTGSRPIDYTVAGIYLLSQRGQLNLDDPITKFIDGVPADKKNMTITHLLRGQSGLPDFFDTPEDWDADLAWVDRNTAIKRMMNQELLFEPGKGQSHSHGAFGLLAGIIELVSGEEYYSFIRKNFLDPAGMTRTGEYGEQRDLKVEDFAVGYGQKVGLPNIPPNWGPTSWLIKGSGGMYSTLGDLQKFYKYIRSGKVLEEKYAKRYMGASANLDGSMRGFELFSAYEYPDNEVYLFLNDKGDSQTLRRVMRALEKLVL